jgi:hypothetical protein
MESENIKDWLAGEPPITEEKDGALYVPIWQVEADLNELCENNWSRHNHKYSLHTDHDGDVWVATSVITEVNYGELRRLLICSSYIRAAEYPDSKNILQTGIAEATKAGVKVLGNRFGYALNDRTVLKEKPAKQRIKPKPDAQILKAYNKALIEKDSQTISRLTTIYDINTG